MSDLLSIYQTFCRVVERHNLTQAGIDLDLAQATVSRHLQELEQRYGVPLLNRTTRRLNITAAGEQVYQYATSLLRSESELAERLVQTGRRLSGRITIAGPGGFGHMVLNRFLVEHGRQHPDLRIRLLLSERYADLIEEGVDLAIRIGTPANSNLIAKALGEVQEILVAAPSLVQRVKLESPQALYQLHRLGLSVLGSSALQFKRGKKHASVDPPASYEVDSALALREASLAGIGWAALHEYLVADDIAQGRLLRLLPEWSLPAWPVNAMYTTRNRPYRVDHLVAAFADYLVSRNITSKRPHFERRQPLG